MISLSITHTTDSASYGKNGNLIPKDTGESNREAKRHKVNKNLKDLFDAVVPSSSTSVSSTLENRLSEEISSSPQCSISAMHFSQENIFKRSSSLPKPNFEREVILDPKNLEQEDHKYDLEAWNQLEKNSGRMNIQYHIYSQKLCRYPNVLCPIATSIKLDNKSYLHANYITFNNQFLCIAAQAPLTNTLNQFFETIFTKQCTIIVDLRTSEDSTYQSYGPIEIGTSTQLDSINVSLVDIEESLENYTIYEYKLVKNDEERTVKRLHYHGWIDHDVIPLETFEHLIKFHKDRFSGQKALIHCNAGVGRTGTYIVGLILDILLQQDRRFFIKENYRTKLTEIILDLRRQRGEFLVPKKPFIFLCNLIRLRMERLCLTPV